MLRLRIESILSEQGHSKYWLYKRMDMSYQNLNHIINNKTSSIRFDILERISDILEVPVGDLFEKVND